MNSSVHRFDARSKLILLLVYSVCLFFVNTCLGITCEALLFLLMLVVSKLPIGKVFAIAFPVYVIAIFTVLANGFIFEDGRFEFYAQGFEHGCFFALRILLLVWASLVVCFSTTSTQLTDALGKLLSPFRKIHVPVDDIAMVASIALRFIPVTADEYFKIRCAQASRGASLDDGPVFVRIRAHVAIFVPLLVGLFRRADNLAQAMDARCYAISNTPRTSISAHRLSVSDASLTVAGCIVFIALAAFL